MEDAYKILVGNRNVLANLTEDKKDEKIFTRFISIRKFAYGNGRGIIPAVKIKDMKEMEKVKQIIALDMKYLLAYDKISTPGKRAEYDRKLDKRQSEAQLPLTQVGEIELEVNRMLKTTDINAAFVDSNGRKTRAYQILDVLKKENESYATREESELFNKKIKTNYDYQMSMIEENIIAGINKAENTREVDVERELKLCKMQLNLKWAYERLKDRESRLKYNSQLEYELSPAEIKEIRETPIMKKGARKVNNPIKYVIDWDSEEFFLRKLNSPEEEKYELDCGKKVISLTRELAYKENNIVNSRLEEYTVERMVAGEYKKDTVITSYLRIADITKYKGYVANRGYSNFTLGKVFSEESIEGCSKYRYGYIGHTELDQRGQYIQKFDREALVVAKQFKENQISIGE